MGVIKQKQQLSGTLNVLIGFNVNDVTHSTLVPSGFLLLATIGYKKSLWVVAIALVGQL
jgi:hypothetical protein